METKQGQSAADVQSGRERFVPRGVATTDLAVVRAEGATVWDADGREYLDFAGGIACQNLGHNPEPVVQAIHEQVDRYLHQCFMVGLYEPYVEVCRRLDDLWPGPSETKTLLVNSGAEAIENAVKIARFATRRPGVIVFDRAFHGRTNLTMAMTSKLVYKQGFGPLAPEVYRAPAPYPYRGVTTDDALAGIELLFKQDVDPGAVACVVLETVEGEGGFIPMPQEFVIKLRELCERHGILYVADEVQCGCGRTGPVWAIEHFEVEPDLLVSGKSLGGGLPLAGVTGRAEIMDAVHAGGLGGTFGGNPLACAVGMAALDVIVSERLPERSFETGAYFMSRLRAMNSSHVKEIRGKGLLIGVEIMEKRGKARPYCEKLMDLGILAKETHDQVIRFAPPLVISREEADWALERIARVLA